MARPFGVVGCGLWCCRFLLTDQVCSALNVLPESSDFSRLLLDCDSPHPPIDCLHGPPSPSLLYHPSLIIHRFRIKQGCQALPFRTVVFSAAIAFLCPDALRSNNRLFPFMRCRSWVLPSTRFPMIVNLCPNTAPTVSITWWRQGEEARTISAAFRTNMVHRGHECEPPSESWPPGSGKP